MKTFKASKKSARLGFTLIELLATLTIMAVIAAILFPFVTNYTKKANRDTSIRSLRILQDAMDRYRASYEGDIDWQIGTGASGSGDYASYKLLDNTQAQGIINELVSATNTNQTLRLPTDGILAGTNVYIVSTASTAATSGWEVLWYRRATNVTGVTRRGGTNEVDEATWLKGPVGTDIDAAFAQ